MIRLSVTLIARSIVVLTLGWATFPAVGQPRDVQGSADSALVTRFPGSEIVDYHLEPAANYTLVLGRMQRINGRVLPSASERVQGELTRITYAVPSAFNAEEVFEHFRRQLLRGGEAPLFTCQGRACGSSNFWANEVFSNRILYGPEPNQYYLAASALADGGTAHIAVYVITRANRRMYAHLDILQPEGQAAGIRITPEAIVQQLQRDGSVVLEDIEFDTADALVNSAGIDLAVTALRREPLLDIYVVGHLQASEPLEQLLARSESRARTVRDALVSAGIDPGRLIARGVGPLAPFCSNNPCEQRIELVLQ